MTPAEPLTPEALYRRGAFWMAGRAGVATHCGRLCRLPGPNGLTIGSASLCLTQIKAGPGKSRQR
jgi:hypothetical protein